jgi:hypothetical protein
MDTPREVRDLVEQLSQSLVQAIMSNEEGQKIISLIQQNGFEVGLILEATVALHPRDDLDDLESCPAALRNIHFPGHDPDNAIRHEDFKNNCEWSEEDRALMCNFNISLD